MHTHTAAFAGPDIDAGKGVQVGGTKIWLLAVHHSRPGTVHNKSQRPRHEPAEENKFKESYAGNRCTSKISQRVSLL